MSWSCASAWTPLTRASLARGLSSEPKSSVSPGSMSFRRNFPPFVTRNFLDKRRDLLTTFLMSMCPTGRCLGPQRNVLRQVGREEVPDLAFDLDVAGGLGRGDDGLGLREVVLVQVHDRLVDRQNFVPELRRRLVG